MPDKPPIQVATYRGATQEEAARAFAADAVRAAEFGYEPWSDAWDGTTLTVTYRLSAEPGAAPPPATPRAAAPEEVADAAPTPAADQAAIAAHQEEAEVPNWEYAMFKDPDTGEDGVAFSRSQGPTLVPEFSRLLGRGLKAENSHERWLHVNLNHTTPIIIIGLLGERGWEMCGFSTLTGGHAYWMFRRPLA